MFEGARKLIRERGVNWWMASYITLVHLLAVAGLFYVPACKWQTLLWAFVLWPISGILGVTGGVHRWASHKSYKAKLPLRVIIMLCNSIANQGSIRRWAIEHSVHHLHSEKAADPHNAKLGFFYSHMGWLFVYKSKEYFQAKKTINTNHLDNDGVVMWQQKYCQVLLGRVDC